jgi:hypothetical protein
MTNLTDPVQVATWVPRGMRDELHVAVRAADLSISQWLRRAIAEKLERDSDG